MNGALKRAHTPPLLHLGSGFGSSCSLPSLEGATACAS